ncbi:MAG: molybdenum cofactor biosynthesis protein B [Gammaproteobacteria bacterium]|nr:molybdenum cofactor biosynthesis protein B [Gammaproteobacteria bacterium]
MDKNKNDSAEDGARLEGGRVFQPLRIAVLTVSDSRDESSDRSGKLLAESLQAAGHRLHDKRIVPDEPARVREAVAGWCVPDGPHAVLVTGGTGITGRDGTPEAVRPLFDKEIPGFGEMFRSLSYQEIGTSALQSRAVAGVSGGCYIFCLPGSPGACRTAWDRIVAAQLDSRTRPCNLAELMPRLNE